MCLGEEGKFVCCFHIPILVLMEGKKQIFMEPFLLCCYIFCNPYDSYHSWWLSISGTGSRLARVTNYSPHCPHLGLALHLQLCWNFGIKGVISAPNTNNFGFRGIFLHNTGGRVEQLHPKGRWRIWEAVKTRQLWVGWVFTDPQTLSLLLVPHFLLTKLQIHPILRCIYNLVSSSVGVEANWMQEASPTLLLFTGTPTFMSMSPDWCWYFHCENKYRRQHSEAIPCLAMFPTEMN